MITDYSKFSRVVLEDFPSNDRKKLLAELKSHLTERLLAYKSQNVYWQEVDCIISDLRAVGHDLWSHHYDGQYHLWGWDYNRPDTAGNLQIQFDQQGSVITFWRTENPQSVILYEDWPR